jgi:hypothetical protein
MPWSTDGVPTVAATVVPSSVVPTTTVGATVVLSSDVPTAMGTPVSAAEVPIIVATPVQVSERSDSWASASEDSFGSFVSMLRTMSGRRNAEDQVRSFDAVLKAEYVATVGQATWK